MKGLVGDYEGHQGGLNRGATTAARATGTAPAVPSRAIAATTSAALRRRRRGHASRSRAPHRARGGG